MKKYTSTDRDIKKRPKTKKSTSFVTQPKKKEDDTRDRAHTNPKHGKVSFAKPLKIMKHNSKKRTKSMVSPKIIRRRATVYRVVSQTDRIDLSKINKIRVIARVRPDNQEEKKMVSKRGLKGKPLVYRGTKELLCPVEKRPEPLSFKMDHILKPETKQHDVYKATGEPMLAAALQGYNTTVFAYGQTGSGKTYTTFGKGEIQKP
eukprot:UN32384